MKRVKMRGRGLIGDGAGEGVGEIFIRGLKKVCKLMDIEYERSRRRWKLYGHILGMRQGENRRMATKEISGTC